ncbi:LytR/AlgR family response regulator transcription factor [Bacillus solimangrovi]|uniref:DNA-binding response regulator n=1 Tax=Bacillus solimangrovi TaxID=1305675 RepID=A0A1E5LBB2_9BACI|nr:LytTR family DNA-binding domain-containing protein [Bacillus solimangrovi]OEH91375.1 hypothetical protein BFG57_05785 [Bacillus solimangrovi]
MSKMKVLIVDDEPMILKRLTKMLEKTNEIKVISVESAVNFEEKYEKISPDFVILDIDLPCKSGLTLARNIRQQNQEIPIVFLTGHAEYALESYDIGVIDYLLKPITEEKLYRCIERVQRALHINDSSWERIEKMFISPGKIVIKQDANLVFLETGNILLIKKDGRKTIIISMEEQAGQLKETVHYTSESMKDIHNRLDQNMFIRTHNSYIINLKWVYEVVRYSTEAYKVKFKYTKEYALLNRAKLTYLVQKMK